MSTLVTQTSLQELRPGDRISYSSIDWDIVDYSTYQDPEGYQTDEWLLKSLSGAEYYLMREYDPTNLETPLTWYLAQQLENVHLSLPDSQQNIVPKLWPAMQSNSSPYPEVKLSYKSYYFESQTRGNYQTKSTKKHRITWDYWDQDHTNNLAIEAFPNYQLDIYSTQIVQPRQFYNIQKGVGRQRKTPKFTFVQGIELLLAISLLIFGTFLFLFG